VLAVFAVAFGWVGIPEHFPGLGGILPNWFHEFIGSMLGGAHEAEFSWVPLVTSLTVALGGLLAGWAAYRNVKAPAQDALQIPLLKNKWYIDEIYSAVFIGPSIWIADKVVYQVIDKGLIDGILHLFGKGTAIIGSALRNLIDKPVINAFFGDGTANLMQGTGRGLQPIQTGRIQQYMLATLLVMLIITGVALFLLARV